MTRDLALVSHTHQHMQEKTTRLSMFSQEVGLNSSQKKTEVMMLNVPKPSPVKMNEQNLPLPKKFTYLGSTVRHEGKAGSDIRSRLNRARNACRMLSNEWKSFQYSTKIKLRLYLSCVLSTLLYGSEY